jgi:hypothetical protein
MTPRDACRQILAAIATTLATTVPPGRTQSLRALLRAGKTMARADDPTRATRPGGHLTLRLCRERHDDADGNRPGGHGDLLRNHRAAPGG